MVGCCYPHSKLALIGPDGDIVFYERMLQRFGFDEIHVLSDRKLGLESSHRGNVLRGVQWLVEGAVAGDSLAFIFSGHGGGVHGTGSDRRDELDRALLAADLDMQFPQNLVHEDELQSLFATLSPGVLLTCILDCPFGDMVVDSAWLYDAKTASFCAPMKARRSSIWPGSRRRVVGPLAPFAPRGTPLYAARVVPPILSTKPRALAPGVAAFVLCACRPDQVCIEAPGPGQGLWQGVFTASLASVLAEMPNMSGSFQGCQLSYALLASAVQTAVQTKLSDLGADQLGFEQTILMSCSADPNCTNFLEPPQLGTSLGLPQVSASAPRPLAPAAVNTVAASLAAAEFGELRWPHMLVQLCRLRARPVAKSPSEAIKALQDCQVVGEFWLPPVAHLFPDQALPGDPEPHIPSKTNSTSFDSGCLRQKLWCQLCEPPLKSERPCLTWAADHPQSLSEAVNDGAGEDADPFPMFPSSEAGYRRTSWRRIFVRILVLARRRGADLTAAAGKLADLATSQNQGVLSSVELEYFAVRFLNLELAEVRAALAEGLEGTPTAAMAEFLQEFLGGLRRGVHSVANGPVEVRLHLEWCPTAVGSGGLRLLAVELWQRKPRICDDQARCDGGTGPTTGTSRPRSVRGRSCLVRTQMPSSLFLRFGLSANCDATPTGSVTQTPMIPSTSWVLPHIVHVTPPLLQGTQPGSGEPFLRMEPSQGPASPAWASFYMDATVPICTTARLCQVQRAALNLPCSAALERCLSPRKREVDKHPGTQKVLPSLPSLQLARTGSEPQLASPARKAQVLV